MKLAISGGSGKTGFRVAEEALKNNINVRLLVRKDSIIPKSLLNQEKAEISLSAPSSLDTALDGCDSLVIATGARPNIDLTGPCKIDSRGVDQQVQSCKRKGIKRIVLVSSLCAGKLIHPLNLFGLILIFKRLGERKLETSGLDWTIIRPGGLNENEENLNTQYINYTSANQQEEGSIPRRLVAKSCIEALKTKESIGKILEITSNENSNNKSLKNSILDFNV